MRFTNVLLALPFVASVFAAPMSPAPISDLVEKTVVPAPKCDVHAVVADLHRSIFAIADITPASTQAQVENCLKTVVGAFDHCGQALGVNLALGANLQVEIAKYINFTHDKAKFDAITKLLAEVTVKVDKIVKATPKALLKLQAIIKLIKHINTCLCGLLTCYNKVLPGCFKVVTNLCLLSGVKLDLVNGLLGGVFSLLGL